MRRSHLSPTLSIRATLAFFMALVVGAIALVILETKPAESQQVPTQPLYDVHDLGELPGGAFSYAFGINEAGKVVGDASLNFIPEVGAVQHPFLYSHGVMSDLGTLGGPNAHASDINDADKVVGASDTSAESSEIHAFLYSGGQMQDLGTLPGYPDSDAAAINNNDEVVGAAFSEELGVRAFLYSDGKMQDLGTLGGTTSIAYGINEAGKVVGEAATSNNEVHAFLYSGGKMQDLGTLGGGGSRAFDINEADKVVGASDTSAGEQHTFLYSGGQMQDLGTLEEPYNFYSIPTAINNADQIVGQSANSDGREHPFLYSDGVMTDLNSLIPADSGWELANVEDINDNGHIVGKGINKDGREHAFLLTPKSYLPPWVISTRPKANADEVAPTANVKATFSEEMDSTTIDSQTFKIFKKGSTTQIAAQVSYNADTDTAKLDPTNNLRRGVAYKAVVTTWPKDMAGNRLDQDDSTSGFQQKRWFFRVDD